MPNDFAHLHVHTQFSLLDGLIKIPEPDSKAREAILKIYTKDMPIGEDVDLNKIASSIDFFVHPLCMPTFE